MPDLMKGKVWGEHKHKLVYPVLAEVKYDEIRCHVKLVETDNGNDLVFLSYAGKPLHNMEEFKNIFWEYLDKANLTELDCGIEVNGNFNDSYRWVRSKIVPEGLDSSMVRFILFDMPDHGALSYKTRRAHIAEAAQALRVTWGLNITTPLFNLCNTEKDVEYFFERYRGLGFEGAMVKTLDHLYLKGKRIAGWLKMKPEAEADGVITALYEAYCGTDQPELNLRKGDPLGRIGSVQLKLEDGSEAAPHGIPHDLGREMYLNPQAYLGEWVEFRYMERDRQGGYRHPVWHRLREAKA